jgi:hypothetical protein
MKHSYHALELHLTRSGSKSLALVLDKRSRVALRKVEVLEVVVEFGGGTSRKELTLLPISFKAGVGTLYVISIAVI